MSLPPFCTRARTRMVPRITMRGPQKEMACPQASPQGSCPEGSGCPFHATSQLQFHPAGVTPGPTSPQRKQVTWHGLRQLYSRAVTAMAALRRYAVRTRNHHRPIFTRRYWFCAFSTGSPRMLSKENDVKTNKHSVRFTRRPVPHCVCRWSPDPTDQPRPECESVPSHAVG